MLIRANSFRLGLTLVTTQAILGARERDPLAKLCAIYPILVGRPCRPDEPHYPASGNFFTDGSADGLRRLVDRVSPPTMDAVAAFLQKQRIKVDKRALQMPVAATVKELFALQGAQLWNHQVAAMMHCFPRHLSPSHPTNGAFSQTPSLFLHHSNHYSENPDLSQSTSGSWAHPERRGAL